MAAMHCNREEFDAISKPDRRFLHTLAAYLLPRLVLTRTLRLLENRLVGALVAPWVLWSGVGRALELSPLGVVLRGACAFQSFCQLSVRVKGAHR